MSFFCTREKKINSLRSCSHVQFESCTRVCLCVCACPDERFSVMSLKVRLTLPSESVAAASQTRSGALSIKRRRQTRASRRQTPGAGDRRGGGDDEN